MFLRKGDVGITPNRWLTVEAPSRMMVQTPNQRLRIRTPSFLTPVPSRASLATVSVGRLSFAVTPGGAQISASCLTPAPVYQVPCRSYFQGHCDNPACVDSHDPSQVAKCRLFMGKNICNQGDQCEFRHDLSSQPDPRARFNIADYRKRELEKANELKKRIEKEQHENREKKKEVYTRTVYSQSVDLDDKNDTVGFDQAMAHVNTLKDTCTTVSEPVPEVPSAPAVSVNIIEASPGGSQSIRELQTNDDHSMIDLDADDYFDELLEWLSGCNIQEWSPLEVYRFFTEARVGEPIHSSNSMYLMNMLFTIYCPSYLSWAAFIDMMDFNTTQLAKLMKNWLQHDDITELHVGGLYAGLLQQDNTKWTLDKMAKLLIQTINIHRPEMGLACSNFSSVLPDGCFILGMAKYLDQSTVAKLTKCYLKSKAQKYEMECSCDTFECTCPSFIDWDLYGVHVFRPVFDYSDWTLEQKAEFFSKASESLWVEIEITAIMEQILGTDEESKSKVLLASKPKEADDRITKHLLVNSEEAALQEIANLSIQSADDDVMTYDDDKVTAKPMGITSIYSVCKNVKTDGEEPEQCTNVSALSCVYDMCMECCEGVENRKCTAHTRMRSRSSVSGVNINEFNKLICTAEDEHWDEVTFGSVQPTMSFDTSNEFENYILDSEGKQTKLKKITLNNGLGLSDTHIEKMADIFGQHLEVFEILSANSGDKFNITDSSAPYLIKMPKLQKLRLVACTKITDKAVTTIFNHCHDLQNVEISGAASFSGFLTDKCLKPLFEGCLPDLHLLNLLDQYFIHASTVDRLRRKRKNVKIIFGERDDGEGTERKNSLFHGGCISPYTTPDSFRE